MITSDSVVDGFDEAAASNSWFDLRKSDYCRVIFCDLSTYHEELGAGCRFQITDHVHEDPSDYVGLYRVGWNNLTSPIAYKFLSEIECEENGKMLRCFFKGKELPDLQEGYYQFLYVTSDNEVCGASTPFEVKKLAKESSDEDVVADKIEDDFLIVRSNLSEKNTFLENKVAEFEKKVNSLELENKVLVGELEKKSQKNISLLKLKESIVAEHQSCSTKIESLDTSIQRLTESNEKYKHCILECQDKITEQANDLKKSKQEINKYEDINCHLRSQVKHFEKISDEKRIHLENQNHLLENTKSMLQAAEESKRLAIEAFRKSGIRTGSEWKEPLVEKFLLKLKLKDAEKLNEKLRNELKEMEGAVVELNQVVKEKHLLLNKTREDQVTLQERLEQAIPKEREIKMKDMIEDLSSKCAIWEEEVADLKAHCADLNKSIEKKDYDNSKLKEECIKKEAIIEFLTLEKDGLLKKQAPMVEAVSDMGARLRMAAELYKEQYLKINSLKKILKSKSKVLSSSCFECSMRDLSCVPSRSLDASGPPSSGVSVATQNSDSDTGEHVQKATGSEKMINVEAENNQKEESSQVHLPMCSKSLDSFTSPHQFPACPSESEKSITESYSEDEAASEDTVHLRIRENTPDPSKSSATVACSEVSIPEKIILPCAICSKPIEIDSGHTQAMVHHLEVAHRQKVCPICGLLFDMKQPPQYFVYHVEEHLHNDNVGY